MYYYFLIQLFNRKQNVNTQGIPNANQYILDQYIPIFIYLSSIIILTNQYNSIKKKSLQEPIPLVRGKFAHRISKLGGQYPQLCTHSRVLSHQGRESLGEKVGGVGSRQVGGKGNGELRCSEVEPRVNLAIQLEETSCIYLCLHGNQSTLETGNRPGGEIKGSANL